MVRVPRERLTAWALACLEKVGVPHDEAKLVAESLVGIGMTHSRAIVVPHGGRHKYFGTNPISFAFPRAGGEPLCLDMATSQVAWNKVLNARIEGRALEPGLAVDGEGNPTTDPA